MLHAELRHRQQKHSLLALSSLQSRLTHHHGFSPQLAGYDWVK